MCEFCRGEREISFGEGYSFFIVETTEGYKLNYLDDNKGEEIGFLISYCPICGRKLTDEENKVNDTIRKENIRLKNDLDTFINYLLPRATIQAGEEIKKGNYNLVTIVTNGERCEQKELLDKISKLEDRHQSDCIKINQLQTTIDVLVDKLAKLREVHEL